MRARTITSVLLSALFLASLGSQTLAQLSGSDDFNDNSRDPAKWDVIAPLLSETSNRLEFTSSGVGDEDGIWAWIANSGSYTQDWTISIDAFNYSVPSPNQWSHVGIFALNSADDTDIFGTGLGVNTENGCLVSGGWEVDGTDYWDAWLPVTSQSAILRISYDATALKLSSSFDAGDGFVSLTNFNVLAWNMDANDTFTIVIGGLSESNFLISSGEIYADNFEAVTLPGISNHLISVSIDYTYKAGNPDSSGDESYKFAFEAETDSTVSNVYVQCPGGYSFNSAIDEIGGGKKYWATSYYSTPPFFSQFGDGEYVVTITYTNGINQSSIIPYAQTDGVTPIPPITELPAFSTPSPLHGTSRSCTDAVTLSWTNIDSNGNEIEIELSNETTDEWTGFYYTDTVAHPYLSYFSVTGPLSTRSADPRYLCPGDWEIELEVNYNVFESNNDGVLYGVSRRGESRYHFVVVDDVPDVDGDDISNCWEIRYFGNPTNAIASLDSDLDGHNNLQEYITGMDPTDSNSVFRITNSAPLADDFLIEWPSVSGRIYSALWTDNLTNSFTPLETGMAYPRNSCTDTVHAGEAKVFYRLEVERSE